jgi:hypothetical protein
VIDVIDIQEHVRLDDYAAFAYLAQGVRDLGAEADLCVPKLRGRKLWMLSSTALLPGFPCPPGMPRMRPVSARAARPGLPAAGCCHPAACRERRPFPDTPQLQRLTVAGPTPNSSAVHEDFSRDPAVVAEMNADPLIRQRVAAERDDRRVGARRRVTEEELRAVHPAAPHPAAPPTRWRSRAAARSSTRRPALTTRR